MFPYSHEVLNPLVSSLSAVFLNAVLLRPPEINIKKAFSEPIITIWADMTKLMQMTSCKVYA